MNLLLICVLTTLTISALTYAFLVKKKYHNLISKIHDEYHMLILEKDQKIQEISIQKLEIIKKILLSCSQLSKEQEQKRKKGEDLLEEDPESIYPQLKMLFFGRYRFFFEWEKFYCILDDMFNNALSKIYKRFPHISPEQFKFYSLLLAKFNTKEIAYILGIKANSVRMRKMLVRNLLGINNGGDIAKFIIDFMDKAEEPKDKLFENHEFFKKLNRKSWRKC